jgi:hypothetical protein
MLNDIHLNISTFVQFKNDKECIACLSVNVSSLTPVVMKGMTKIYFAKSSAFYKNSKFSKKNAVVVFSICLLLSWSANIFSTYSIRYFT